MTGWRNPSVKEKRNQHKDPAGQGNPWLRDHRVKQAAPRTDQKNERGYRVERAGERNILKRRIVGAMSANNQANNAQHKTIPSTSIRCSRMALCGILFRLFASGAKIE